MHGSFRTSAFGWSPVDQVSSGSSSEANPILQMNSGKTAWKLYRLLVGLISNGKPRILPQGFLGKTDQVAQNFAF